MGQWSMFTTATLSWQETLKQSKTTYSPIVTSREIAQGPGGGCSPSSPLHTHRHTQIHTQTHMDTQTQIHRGMQIYTHAYNHRQTCMHTCTHSYIDTWICHTHMHILMDTCMHVHTYTNSHTYHTFASACLLLAPDICLGQILAKVPRDLISCRRQMWFQCLPPVRPPSTKHRAIIVPRVAEKCCESIGGLLTLHEWVAPRIRTGSHTAFESCSPAWQM